jgi:integrase
MTESQRDTKQEGSIGFGRGADVYVQRGGEAIHLPSLIHYFGDTPLDAIDQNAVDRAAQVLKPKAAPSTQSRQVHTVVSAIIKDCASLGLCRWRRFQRPKSDSTRERSLSVEEANRLVLKCSPHIRPLVLLLFEGGRLGELLRLGWDQIDLDARRVLFRRNGKVHILRLHERTVHALMKLPHRHGQVFRTPSGREYTSTRPSVKTAFKSACHRAGIRDLSPRDCSRAGFPFAERPKNEA